MKYVYLILLLALFYSQTAEFAQPADSAVSKLTLRAVLEKLRTTEGFNYIYCDNLVGNIQIDPASAAAATENNIKSLLNRHRLGIKYFGEKNAVIFLKKETAKNNYGSVIVKNILEPGSAEIVEPKIISDLPPVYPAGAVKENVEGTVKIKLFITAKGSVIRTVIQKSSGSAVLDSATVDYAGKLRFIPAKVNGADHSIWLSMIFRYYIKNKMSSE